MEARLESAIESMEQRIKHLDDEVDAIHDCMLRLTRETVNLRRQVADMERVLLEQFETKSEISSVVGAPPRVMLKVRKISLVFND